MVHAVCLPLLLRKSTLWLECGRKVISCAFTLARAAEHRIAGGVVENAGRWQKPVHNAHELANILAAACVHAPRKAAAVCSGGSPMKLAWRFQPYGTPGGFNRCSEREPKFWGGSCGEKLSSPGAGRRKPGGSGRLRQQWQRKLFLCKSDCYLHDNPCALDADAYRVPPTHYDRHTDRHRDGDSGSQPDPIGDAYTDAERKANPDAEANRDPDPAKHRDTDRDADFNCDSQQDSHTHRNRHACAKTCSVLRIRPV